MLTNSKAKLQRSRSSQGKISDQVIVSNSQISSTTRRKHGLGVTAIKQSGQNHKSNFPSSQRLQIPPLGTTQNPKTARTQQTAPSVPTTMPTIGSSATQKNKQIDSKLHNKYGNSSSGSFKNSRNQQFNKTGTKPISVFAPISQASQANSSSKVSKDPVAGGMPPKLKKDASNERLRVKTEDKDPGQKAKRDMYRSQENSTYKSVMSVTYNNQARNNKRVIGKGRKNSSFKADANVKKKDISDSNVYGGSDDEPDLQNKPIASKDKEIIKQASSSSNNSLDDSGIIQEEAPISLVMDSGNNAPSSQVFSGTDNEKFITQKIGKVGMSGLNCNNSKGWVSQQRPSIAPQSCRNSNGTQSNLETLNNKQDQKELKTHRQNGNVMGLFDKVKRMSEFEYKTLDLQSSTYQKQMQIHNKNIGTFKSYQNSRSTHDLGNFEQNKQSFLTQHGRKDIINGSNFNSTCVMQGQDKQLQAKQQITGEYQIVPNFILTQSMQQSIKPSQKQLTSQNITESVQESLPNGSEQKDFQYNKNSNIGGVVALQLQNEILDQKVNTNPLPSIGPNTVESQKTRDVQKPITPLSGTDAINPLSNDGMGPSELTPSPAPSQQNFNDNQYKKIKLHQCKSYSEQKDGPQSSADLSTVQQQQSVSPHNFFNEQTANSFLNNIPDGSSNFMCTSHSKSNDLKRLNIKHTIPNEISDGDEESHHPLNATDIQVISNIDAQLRADNQQFADYGFMGQAGETFGVNSQVYNMISADKSDCDLVDNVLMQNLIKQQEMQMQRQTTEKQFQTGTHGQQTNMSSIQNEFKPISSHDVSSEIGMNGLAQMIQQNTGGLQELSPYEVQKQKELSQLVDAGQDQGRMLTTIPQAQMSPTRQANLMQKIRAHNQTGGGQGNYDSNNTLKYGSYYYNDSSSKKDGGVWPTPEDDVQKASLIEMEGNVQDYQCYNGQEVKKFSEQLQRQSNCIERQPSSKSAYSQQSHLSQIRQELQFPKIEMNKLQNCVHNKFDYVAEQTNSISDEGKRPLTAQNQSFSDDRVGYNNPQLISQDQQITENCQYPGLDSQNLLQLREVLKSENHTPNNKVIVYGSKINGGTQSGPKLPTVNSKLVSQYKRAATTTQTFSPSIAQENDPFNPDEVPLPDPSSNLISFAGNGFPMATGGRNSHIIRQVSLQPSINTSSQRRKKESQLLQQSINESDNEQAIESQLKIVDCDEYEEQQFQHQIHDAPQSSIYNQMKQSKQYPSVGTIESQEDQAMMDEQYNMQRSSQSDNCQSQGIMFKDERSSVDEPRSSNQNEFSKPQNHPVNAHRQKQSSIFGIRGPGLSQSTDSHNNQYICEHMMCGSQHHPYQVASDEGSIPGQPLSARQPYQHQTNPKQCSICASIQKTNCKNYGGTNKDHLENSCVTFQYYNSSKFASNSTNHDRNGQTMQNCFYFTKTTNKTNQSQRSANLSGHCNTHGYNTKQTDGGTAAADIPEKTATAPDAAARTNNNSSSTFVATNGGGTQSFVEGNGGGMEQYLQEGQENNCEQNVHIGGTYHNYHQESAGNQVEESQQMQQYQQQMMIQHQEMDDDGVGSYSYQGAQQQQYPQQQLDQHQYYHHMNDQSNDNMGDVANPGPTPQQIYKHTRIQDLLMRQNETYCEIGGSQEQRPSSFNGEYDLHFAGSNSSTEAMQNHMRYYGNSDSLQEPSYEDDYGCGAEVQHHQQMNIQINQEGAVYSSEPHHHQQFIDQIPQQYYHPGFIQHPNQMMNKEVIQEYDVIQEQSSKDEQSNAQSAESQSHVSSVVRNTQQHGTHLRTSNCNDEGETDEKEFENPYGKQSDSNEQNQQENNNREQFATSLDALTLKKRMKTGEKLTSDNRLILLGKKEKNQLLNGQGESHGRNMQGLDQRPSSVLGPQSSKIVNGDSQLEQQRAYCSLGSSPNQTPDSQDQSYTILQMASSAQKIGVNSNFMQKHLSIKSGGGDGSENNIQQKNQNYAGNTNPFLKPNAFSLSQDRSNSDDKPQNMQYDYQPIIGSEEDQENLENLVEQNSRLNSEQIAEIKQRNSDILQQNSQYEIDNSMKIVNFNREDSDSKDQLISITEKQLQNKLQQIQEEAQKDLQNMDIEVSAPHPVEPSAHHQQDLYEGLKSIQGVDSALLSSLFNNLNQLNALCSTTQASQQPSPLDNLTIQHKKLAATTSIATPSTTQQEPILEPMILNKRPHPNEPHPAHNQLSTEPLNTISDTTLQHRIDKLSQNVKQINSQSKESPSREDPNGYMFNTLENQTLSHVNDSDPLRFKVGNEATSSLSEQQQQELEDFKSQERLIFEQQIEYINQIAIKKTRQSNVGLASKSCTGGFERSRTARQKAVAANGQQNGVAAEAGGTPLVMTGGPDHDFTDMANLGKGDGPRRRNLQYLRTEQIQDEEEDFENGMELRNEGGLHLLTTSGGILGAGETVNMSDQQYDSYLKVTATGHNATGNSASGSSRWQRQFRSRSRSGMKSQQSNGHKSQRSNGNSGPQNQITDNSANPQGKPMLSKANSQQNVLEPYEAPKGLREQRGSLQQQRPKRPRRQSNELVTPGQIIVNQQDTQRSSLQRAQTTRNLQTVGEPSSLQVSIAKVHLLPGKQSQQQLGSKKNSIKVSNNRMSSIEAASHQHSHQESKELSVQIDQSIQQLNSICKNIESGCGGNASNRHSRKSQLSLRSQKQPEQDKKKQRLKEQRRDRNQGEKAGSNAQVSARRQSKTIKQPQEATQGGQQQPVVDSHQSHQQKQNTGATNNNHNESNENKPSVGNTLNDKASPAV